MILMKNIMKMNTIKMTMIIFQMKIQQWKNDITKDTETIIQTLNTIINVVYWIQNINKLIKILFICIIKLRIWQNW